MQPIYRELYQLNHTEDIETPSLVFYPDIIRDNTDKVIAAAGGVERIWAHVKTYKSAGVVHILQEKGIQRFKAATIAEAQLCAECGAAHVFLAYPLLGPNIRRFLTLRRRYPGTHFYATGDDVETVKALGKAAREQGEEPVDFFADVNIGMNRTGVPLDSAVEFYHTAAQLPGIHPVGLHFFSGKFKIHDPAERKAAVEKTGPAILQIRRQLQAEGFAKPLIVLSGTPVLKSYDGYEDVFLSPGTAFITDMQYYRTFEDFDFVPAAVLLTRVISKPAPDLFTLDLGYKGIASDPPTLWGTLLGYEDAREQFHCEEHWNFRAGGRRPALGEVVYVVPTHICPTVALYPSVLTAEDHAVTGAWEVTARNRNIGI